MQSKYKSIYGFFSLLLLGGAAVLGPEPEWDSYCPGLGRQDRNSHRISAANITSYHQLVR